MALARLRCDGDSFGSISYNWYYHIRSGKRHICSVVPPINLAQTISSIFSPNIHLGPNWQQSTTKMAVERLRCDGDSFRSISYNWYYHIRSGKIQLCSVETPTKPAQTIDSIFSPKIQLGRNWQQSTTKMAVARLRCDTGSFGSISYNWYYHISSGTRQLLSVVPPTNPAQAISSIFSPNIQLGPNWQQSTTKMAVSRLRYDGDSFVKYVI